MLRFDIRQQNSVKQLSFNKSNKLKTKQKNKHVDRFSNNFKQDMRSSYVKYCFETH